MNYETKMAEDILRQIKFNQTKAGPGTEFNIASRELVLARDVVHTREVCKDIKIKRSKHTSLVCDNEDDASSNDLLSQTPKGVVSQQVSGNVIAPAKTSTRYTGISVQHCRTRKGIKLSITLQTAEEAESGACLRLTAELKRYDRLHEIKARPEDYATSRQHLEETIAELRTTNNRSACLGRIHDRGKRSEWFLDSFVVGYLTGEVIRQVILYLEGETYHIVLDQELSANQRNLYHSTRIYGHISKGVQAQRRLSTAPRTYFGE